MFQVVSIQAVGTLDVRDAELVDVAVEGIDDGAHACTGLPELGSPWVVIWIALDHPNQVGVHPCS